MLEETPKHERRKWFKFYGADFLLDPKMMQLNSVNKIMWVTLMCLASANGEDGWVRHINDIRLATFAGITPLDDNEFFHVKGTLETFETLSMITIEKLSENDWNVYLDNFEKRQSTNLTPYERVKKHREKVKLSTNNDKKLSMITVDKIREDKNRNNNIVEIQSIYDLYISKFNKNPNQYRLTDKRKKKISARLKDSGYEMLQSAIIRSAGSPFHSGDNDRGWCADLDYITRSYENVEKLSQLESKRKDKSDHIPYKPPRNSDFTDIGAETLNRFQRIANG